MGGAAKAEWERNLGVLELQRRWRVDQSKCRAEKAAYRVSRTILSRFGGPKGAQSTILETGWAADEMEYLRDCIDAIVRHYLAVGDPLAAAPWFELHYDVLRLESSDLATQKVAQALDHLIVASCKRSAPPAIREWRDHFNVLRCRRTLETLLPDKFEIARHLPALEKIARTSNSSFVRSEARIEIAGHHVELDSEEAEQKLADLTNLDRYFNDEKLDWVMAVSPLRPKISRALKLRRPRAAEVEIEKYARIVLPRQTFRYSRVAIEYKRALGERLDISPSALRYRPHISPIEPFADRDLEHWGTNDLKQSSSRR
ncbi:MAG: hypothetical protein HYR72_03725 [Deltaproteobacteria bacterium]|nr:hypothetical protein [Deltaproteobacteria bacterium]MBI3388702.1 hypothetical protein [Deltaproteobacteria bacterium]